MTPSHLTLSNIERSKSGHSDFEALYLVKSRVRSYVTIKHIGRCIWGVHWCDYI